MSFGFFFNNFVKNVLFSVDEWEVGSEIKIIKK